MHLKVWPIQVKKHKSLANQWRTTVTMLKKIYPVRWNQHRKEICNLKQLRELLKLNQCWEASVHLFMGRYKPIKQLLKVTIIKETNRTRIQASQHRLMRHKRRASSPKLLSRINLPMIWYKCETKIDYKYWQFHRNSSLN